MGNIHEYFSDLILKDGLFVSDRLTNISYPEEGNQIYYNIEERSFWFKHRNNCITTLVKKHSIDKSFADIGGGNGYVSKGLMNIGMNPILIEPGMQGCVNAKKRGVENVVCATLEESGCKENSLPNIGLFDVVEHIENDSQFMENISKHLKKDGLLYLTVPSYSFLWSSEDELAGHFRRYSLRQIENLLINNGFTIVYSSYFFTFLPIPILFKRTLLGKIKPRKKTSKHIVQNEHENKSGIVNKILNFLLNREITKISNGKKLNFGSSCILVAKKMKFK
jgi:hypothetical protein